MRSTPRRCAPLMAIALLAGSGCTNDGSVTVSGSTEEATVTGTVKIKGKMATGGEIIFDPSNIKRKDVATTRAKIAKDGSYSITTLVGENTATVEGPEVKKAGLVMKNRKHMEINSGENTLPIEIP